MLQFLPNFCNAVKVKITTNVANKMHGAVSLLTAFSSGILFAILMKEMKNECSNALMKNFSDFSIFIQCIHLLNEVVIS